MTEGENPRHHLTYRYGLTVDRIGLMSDSDGLVMVDIKTGQPDPATQFQMVAYMKGLESNGIRVDKMLGVYLTKDGKYTPRPFVYSDDTWAMFLNLLAIYNWRAENNRL
jgi:hypothetical protein